MSTDSPQALARQLQAALAPSCERLEIAGSIRRGKADPKDIELVAIARVVPITVTDMFGTAVATGQQSLLERGVLELVTLGGEWEYDPVNKKNGPRYKRLRHVASGVCCDLFITRPDAWGIALTIRTGPWEFSKAMVTRAKRYGLAADEGQLWREHRDGRRDVVPVTSEQEFFEQVHVPWLEPAARSLQAFNLATRRQGKGSETINA